jgi:hypothetical protein
MVNLGLRKRLEKARQERTEHEHPEKYADPEYKAYVDSEVKKRKQKQFNESYAKQQLEPKAKGQRLQNIGHALTGPQAKRTGNAAVSGLGFLSGDMFGMSGNSGNINTNLNNLLDFGGPRSHTMQPAIKPKAKRTTIHTGNETITISQRDPNLNQTKKREKSISENIEDLLGF